MYTIGKITIETLGLRMDQVLGKGIFDQDVNFWININDEIVGDDDLLMLTSRYNEFYQRYVVSLSSL